MKETDKKRVPSKDQRKISAKPSRQDHRAQEKKESRPLRAKDNAKAQSVNAESAKLTSDSNTSRESSEVYEDVVIDYMDDTHRSNEAFLNREIVEMADKDAKGELNGCPADLENEPKEGIDEVSDSDTVNDSVSSQGDSFTAEDEKIERDSRVARATENESTRGRSKMQSNSALLKPSIATEKFPSTANKSPKVNGKNMSDNIKNVECQSENASEIPEVNGNPVHEAGEDDNITAIDHERVDSKDNNKLEQKDALCQKIVEMETRIEKLEEELREVAALEIALYSVVPEHGSSAHKVHTPARRLCRLYIHACKHLSSNNRATIAKNIVSGLVLIAKSCGNDVPRLTFWLSNTVALREIICQTFGSSHQPSFPTNVLESNKRGNTDKQGIVQGLGDWQESRTFTTALEKIESWIFSRIVESIWWQTLTPNMQSLSNDSLTVSHSGRILGPSLGDQKQGSISINLWINAFQDAFRRLCPIRGEGHECGCLPVLARKVMEQCLARLDVAMFNAILRESVHEIPTDPVSDPIVDSKVLPIPAGDLSFGSGAQLKNCVGNWTRWLNNKLGIGNNDCVKDDQNRIKDNEVNCFRLLDSLSDLLMLPKDMLMDKSVRIEVCPRISLPLVKRILCNFTPDEFCPDSVPGAVLEALNAECIIEHTVTRESARSFPYSAAPVEYTHPSLADVAAKIAEVGNQSQLSRSASTIQRKGYTSDEDLDDLGSPLESIVEYKLTSSQSNFANGTTKQEEMHYIGCNMRYELLRKVWSDS